MCCVPLEAPLNAMAACKDNSSVHSIPGAGTTFHGRRLIFFNVAESKTEPALLQLFSQHGEVADMFIVRSALGHSSGCGHVTFATAEQARAALKALKGSHDCAEPGTTLGVLLVEEGPSNSSSGTTDDAASTASLSPKAVGASNTAQSQQSAEGKCGKAVFFTKVPPTVTSQQLIQLFTACGEVAHLELFIPWPGAKISRGCGLVEFSCTHAAAAAVHSMHQQFTWPHSHSALVVEWVDRSRQSTNSKSNKPRAGAGGGSSSMGAAGSPAGSLTGTGTSLRAEHLNQQAAAAGHAWRPAHSGEMSQQAFARAGLLGLQQQQQQPGVGRSSRSCPLPQLPPGWHVIGTATAQQLPPGVRAACPSIASQWASVPSSLSSYAGPTRQQQPVPAAAAAVSYLPQTSLQAGMVSRGGEGAAAASALQQQQQLLLQQQQQQRNVGCSSEAGSAGTWLACPATNALSNNSMGASVELNSITSLGSVYDAALLSSSAFSSNANSANNSAVLQSQLVSSWDKQQQQQPTVLDLSGCDSKGALGGMVVAPQYSEPMMMSAATAAAMSGSHNDGILQQLLQQNVMLLQTMTPPPEEEAVAQHLLLPTSGAPAQQGLVGSMVASSTAAVGGGLGGGLPSYVPLSQVQQVPQGQMLYAGSSLPSPQQQQQRQQQLWWLQQAQVQQANQQQQDSSTAVVALPLSDRQLGAMSGVLPEVARMTGAQAWISSAAGGGLQLCLSGSYPQLQAGHAAVAMLLGKAGVDEPLAAAMVHAAAN